ECKVQVNKFPNAVYKKFSTRTEPQNFNEEKREVSVVLNDSIGVFWKDNDPNNLSERLLGSEQTNNRAEIYAVIRALEICENKTKPLKIMTDNLIKRLKKLIDNRIGIVKLVHIRVYLENYRNEQADRLAKHGLLREAVTEISKLENNICITNYFNKK
ncbi:19655_t:CDS:2, partial [Racocetra persica]